MLKLIPKYLFSCIIFLIVGLYFLWLFVTIAPANSHIYHIPRLQVQLERVDLAESKTLQLLQKLSIELNRYKNKYRMYPISRDWDRAAGSENLFLKNIYSMVSNNKPVPAQIMYISNGANYKLIATNVDDCHLVKVISWELVIDYEECTAYGIWTNYNTSWWGLPSELNHFKSR